MITLTMQIYYNLSKLLCNNDRIILPQQALDQDRMLQLGRMVKMFNVSRRSQAKPHQLAIPINFAHDLFGFGLVACWYLLVV